MSDLPCPFCGSREIEENSNTVVCIQCGAQGPDIGENPGGLCALELWNRRTLGRAELVDTIPAPPPEPSDNDPCYCGSGLTAGKCQAPIKIPS